MFLFFCALAAALKLPDGRHYTVPEIANCSVARSTVFYMLLHKVDHFQDYCVDEVEFAQYQKRHSSQWTQATRVLGTALREFFGANHSLSDPKGFVALCDGDGDGEVCIRDMVYLAETCFVTCEEVKTFSKRLI